MYYFVSPGDEGSISWAGRWELAFWALALLITALLVFFRPLWLVRAEGVFRRASQHRARCAWGLGVAVIAIRVALLRFIPVPIPCILDEFSYLLGADTFAAGRLTNPPHPMWVHFETFNVNMRPTYQSMYPPAQGLVLALGQWLTGSPWIAVLLSVAVMCGVFCWMLQGWMPPQWALLGGIYAVVRYGIFSYWINSYWGGAVAAIGGALLLGSLPRLRRKLSWQLGVVFVLGLVILANSRPLEGFLFALPFLCAFAWIVFRARLPRMQLLTRVLMPGLLLLGLACAWMAYYNWRSTGSPLQMPYSINQATYHISKPFIFQKAYPIPKYRNPQLRTFYVLHEYPDVLRAQSAWGLEILITQKFFCYYVFFVWPLLLLFVPGMMFAARNAELRVVFFAILTLLIGLTLQLWPAHGHYAAPAAGAVLLILLHSLRELSRVRDWAWLPWLRRSIVLMVFLCMLLPISERLWNPYSFDVNSGNSNVSVPKEVDRERLLAHVGRLPGQHLILVHYALLEIPSKEWVYNRADIDNSKIIWARDMGTEANKELLRYYPNRHIWYVDRGNGGLLVSYNEFFQLTHPASGLLPGID